MELKAISGHEIREDVDYNTRGVDPEDKEWRKYGKELCDTLYYRKSEADEALSEKDAEIRKLKRALYKACANWASTAKFDRFDDFYLWEKMERKCQAKAEEYK